MRNGSMAVIGAMAGCVVDGVGGGVAAGEERGSPW
jgi:hypothetical protein